MSAPEQTPDLHAYFSRLYPDDPQLAADAAAANRMLGWTPPPEKLSEQLPEPGATMPMTGAAPPPASVRAARRRIDWGQAARLLAGGSSVEDAAGQLRCAPQAIRRNLRRSRRFRLRIEGEHAHARLMAQLRFGALGDYAISHLKLHPDNPRLLQWLGDRIGLGELAGGRAGAGLARRLQSALYPGQRIPTDEEAEERRLSNAEVQRLIREADEWHEAKEAHDRAMAEKKAFEKSQRAEEARQSGESNDD